MTDQSYQEIKKTYLDNITRMMTDTGGMPAHIAVFGVHKDEFLKVREAIIHIQIPGEVLKSDRGKDLFFDKVLPGIASKIREVITPHGVAWTSEAYMRTASKDEEIPENWKDLPIQKEVLIVNMEFEHINETLLYEIVRDGQQVTEDGDLVDHIVLREMEDMKSPEMVSGRFTGLYQKFKAE